ncbi:MAG: antitoxin family protein [archaeon]|nr:antitoxin family protein [archaeon]
MEKTIKARFLDGIFKPLEKVELEEGKEVIVTIKEIPKAKEKKDAFERAAGSWKDLVDTERLIKDIYESRRIRAPEVKL